MSAAILMGGLGNDYGPVVAVSDLSLEVHRGEIFGFLGAHGAGTTTVMRILLDLIRATAGRVWVLGHDSRRRSVAVRAQVGHVPWEAPTTGRLGADLTRPTGELSQGNRQVVALLLALADRPPVLALDEPTGGLDPLGRPGVLAILAEEAAADAAVFLSSHVLGEVAGAPGGR